MHIVYQKYKYISLHSIKEIGSFAAAHKMHAQQIVFDLSKSFEPILHYHLFLAIQIIQNPIKESKMAIITRKSKRGNVRGTWYFVNLTDHGFPTRTQKCDFSKHNFTLVGVFVPDSNPHTPVEVNNYAVMGLVDADFRYTERNRERALPIRVNRPFRFHPDRAQTDEEHCVEWLRPQADIETQLAIGDEPLGEVTPTHPVDISQFRGIPDPVSVPTQGEQSAENLEERLQDFAIWRDQPHRDIVRNTSGPVETVVHNVKPPVFRYEVPADKWETETEIYQWDQQIVTAVPEPQTLRFPFTKVYTPVEFPIDRPTAHLRLQDGRDFPVVLPYQFMARYLIIELDVVICYLYLQ